MNEWVQFFWCLVSKLVSSLNSWMFMSHWSKEWVNQELLKQGMSEGRNEWSKVLIFEWLCFKEATSVFAYLLKIGWVTHEKIIWKVPQLLLVVLIPETLNMTSGQRFKLLRSGVPRSMYREKLVITVWFIVSSYMLHFCWHRQSCIDSTKSVSHLVVSWQSLVLVSSDIPLSMYMDMSQNEVSFLGPKWLP